MQAYETKHAARRHASGAAAGFRFLPLFRRPRGQDAPEARVPKLAGRRGAPASAALEQRDEIARRSDRFASMPDFLAALGLFFAIEGIFLAAFPGGAKRAMATVLEMPDGPLRIAGIVSALIGVVIVWHGAGLSTVWCWVAFPPQSGHNAAAPRLVLRRDQDGGTFLAKSSPFSGALTSMSRHFHVRRHLWLIAALSAAVFVLPARPAAARVRRTSPTSPSR